MDETASWTPCGGGAAKDRNGLAEPEDVATELGIGLFQVTELVRRCQDDFEWNAVPFGKLKLR